MKPLSTVTTELPASEKTSLRVSGVCLPPFFLVSFQKSFVLFPVEPTQLPRSAVERVGCLESKGESVALKECTWKDRPSSHLCFDSRVARGRWVLEPWPFGLADCAVRLLHAQCSWQMCQGQTHTHTRVSSTDKKDISHNLSSPSKSSTSINVAFWKRNQRRVPWHRSKKCVRLVSGKTFASCCGSKRSQETSTG